MQRNVLLIALLLTMVAVSATGQDRSIWRTATDIREGGVGSIVGTVVDLEAGQRRIHIQPDNDPHQRVVVTSDSVSTEYYGFGGVINGSPEIFRGSSGFANVRIGDRIDVHGVGRPGASISAGQITLIGRSVEAGSVGVGTTRTGTSVSTPTNTIPSGRATVGARVAEGTVRQVNINDGSIVIQTPQRRMITINTTRNTPVYYRGETYRVGNLEVGDVIRVEPEPRSATADEITARSIEVTRSAQDAPTARPADQRLTAVIGRVTRVDRGGDLLEIDTGRENVRVDMLRAADANGRQIRAADVRVGDEVDITGSYSANSDVFVASTVRFGGGRDIAPAPSDTEVFVDAGRIAEYVIVSFSGTVTESLQTSPTLVVRDRATGRTVQVFVTEDFVIRTRANAHAAARTLKAGDNLLIKAYRDQAGNMVAQTIRVR